MNTAGDKRAKTVFMGSGFSPAGCPGMTKLARGASLYLRWFKVK